MSHRSVILVFLFLLLLDNVACQQTTVARKRIMASAPDVPVEETQEPARQNLKLPLVDPRIVREQRLDMGLRRVGE